jgi:hypothetical protein
MFHYMAGWATKIEGNTINIARSGQAPRGNPRQARIRRRACPVP